MGGRFRAFAPWYVCITVFFLCADIHGGASALPMPPDMGGDFGDYAALCGRQVGRGRDMRKRAQMAVQGTETAATIPYTAATLSADFDGWQRSHAAAGGAVLAAYGIGDDMGGNAADMTTAQKMRIFRTAARAYGFDFSECVHNAQKLMFALDVLDNLYFSLLLVPLDTMTPVFFNLPPSTFAAVLHAAAVFQDTEPPNGEDSYINPNDVNDNTANNNILYNNSGNNVIYNNNTVNNNYMGYYGSNCNNLSAVDILSEHSNYVKSYIVQEAFNSNKPPVFSIYYLKSFYRQYDTPQNAAAAPSDVLAVTAAGGAGLLTFDTDIGY